MSIETQRIHSISSLRRHEAARDRATKLKSVPVTVALEIAAEDSRESSEAELEFSSGGCGPSEGPHAYDLETDEAETEDDGL
jgi:hypothetical protein